MRDYLLDIVKNTYGLGIVDLVKITSNAESTHIDAIAEDRSVIIQAKTNQPVAEFNGVFGMPNLGKLNTILNIPEYAKDAKISLKYEDRNGETVAAGLHFENAAGDFKNDYRFMAQGIIEDRVKSVKFQGAKWDVDFEPSQAAIQRLKFQANANSEETTFIAKTEDGNLKFFFGDHSSHAGNFVFEAGVAGTVSKGWGWPVSSFVSILNLTGDKSLRISDIGAAQITVNTGIATYNYYFPGQTK